MSSRRKVVIGIIVGVVVIAGVLSVIFWPTVSKVAGDIISTIRGTSGNSDQGSDDTVALPEEEVLYQKAEAAAENGGAEAGHKILDDKLAQTTDPKEQAALYIQKSNLASTPSGGDSYAKSLEYAYKAEEIYPTYESALVIGSLSELTGDKTTAVKYYKLYLARVPQEVVDLNPGDKEYYTNQIKVLEAQR
jgi:hypothetical protein